MPRKKKWRDAVDIEGKTAVFVGSSSQMIGRGIGAFIDRFDVVIRTLGASGKLGFNTEDLGTRNDILFCNAVVERRLRPLPLESLAEQGVKQIVFRKTMRCKKYTDQKNPPVHCTKTQYNHISGINGMPLMAAQAVKWLEDRGAGFIFITGCDFYMHAGINTNLGDNRPEKYWIKGYQAEALGKKKPKGVRRWGQKVGRPTRPSAGHNIPSHLNWFANKLRQGNIYCDDILASIMNDWYDRTHEEEKEQRRVQQIERKMRAEEAKKLTDIIGAVR